MESSYVLQLKNHPFPDMYLCFCGYEDCQPLHSFGPAVRPNYILHYILKGKGTFRAGGVVYELTAGQGFLIEPGVQTFYQADASEPWSYVWIGFDGARPAGRTAACMSAKPWNSSRTIIAIPSASPTRRIMCELTGAICTRCSAESSAYLPRNISPTAA